jgi:hypothetical protein
MNTPVLIIDNHIELQAIEKQYPDLMNARLILLSSNFSQEQITSYTKRGFCYFDDNISTEEASFFSSEINYIMWNWFLDDTGKDLSAFDGCSLGATFVHSLEMLLNTAFKYLTSLRNILDENYIVYCSSQVESVFLEIINFLEKEISFHLCVVETGDTTQIITQGKRNLKMDIRGRYRDHTPMFKNINLKQKILSNLLLLLQSTINKKSKKYVLFMPAGKHQSYFQHIKKNMDSNNFGWILPFSGLRDFFLIKNRSLLFYYFSATGQKHSEEVTSLIDKLKKNIEHQVKQMDYKLMISLMDRHIFIYFQGALNYFNSAVKMLRVLEPKLMILSSESHESFVLVGQAAKKQKIKTALIPHGIYGRGYPEYKKGRFQWIDYGLAFGRLDKDKFLSSGIDKDKIYITGHPYFERFLSIRKERLEKEYKKVILLPPDVHPREGSDKINKEYIFYENMVHLMSLLDIEIIGIKIRDIVHVKARSMKNSIEINGKKLPLIVGETSFPDAIKNADLVIGPSSTAVIESGLLGIDYYVYEPKPPGLFDQFQVCFYNYINVSHDTAQLKDNILKKKPYLSGCSVNDLLDWDSVTTKQDIFRKFEKVIKSILN